MRKSMGVVLLAVFALLCALAIKAAPQQQPRAQAPENPYAGLPWAYGFATPVPAAPAAGGRGGGGAAPAAGGRGGAGAPAAPGAAPAPAEDPNEPRHVPGSTLTFTLKEVGANGAPADWFPQDHPTMPDIVAHGDRARMVNACGFCHYPNGKGRPNNAGPAGLPAAYILQQIQDFQDGARTSWDKRKRNTGQMVAIAQGLSPEEAKTAANYFSSMKWTPWVKVVEADMVPKTQFVGNGGGLDMPVDKAEAGMEPLGNRIVETPVDPDQTEPLRNPRSGFIAYVPPGSLKRGKELVEFGGNGKTVGCASCHGEGLKGHENFPSLAGRSPSYLARQLLDFQHYARVGPGSQLMLPIVQNLSEDDILAIVAYVASLPPQ